MEIKPVLRAQISGSKRAFGGQLLDIFFPPVCLVCESPLFEVAGKSRFYSSVLCQECAPSQEDLHLSGTNFGEKQGSGDCDTHCEICGESCESYGLRDGRCLPCILVPLGVRRLHSIWSYAERTERLIKSFKYARRRALAEYLGLAIAPAIRSYMNSQTVTRDTTRSNDLLVAIPSPSESLRSRGFAHLGLLLRVIRRELCIPADILALRAAPGRQVQAGLHLVERAANARGSTVASAKRIAGKRIFLIDDVLTTGSSIAAAARALRKAGATEVIAFTLARSPRFQTNRLKASLHDTSRR